MSALRWDELHHRAAWPERLADSLPDTTPDPESRMACAEDDDPARGIVLGVAATLTGFWVPLAAAVAAFRRRR